MQDIVYKGIALPTEYDPYPNMKEEQDLIRDSIITILLTKLGQRFFVPDFGSRLWSLVFEPNDTVTEQLADRYVREALKTWEPRVRVVKVDYFPDQREENVLRIRITYIILRISEIMSLTLDISRDRFSIVTPV